MHLNKKQIEMSKSSLEAAAEAAAKVNAMLIAKGKLKLPPDQIKPKIGIVVDRAVDDLFTSEVEINDVPLGARNLLTKGHTQDEICKYSGAAISTRGRYMTYEDKLTNNTGEKLLYLHIQASSKNFVNLAVSRVVEIISQYDKLAALKVPITNSVTSSAVNSPLGATSGLHFIQEKVFVGLETPPNFSVRDKLLGPNGTYLQHIKAETGANVMLRGRGSGYIEPTSGREAFEPMYIHLTHPKLEGIKPAKALAMNLVDTVHLEYAQWQQQHQAINPNQFPFQSNEVHFQHQISHIQLQNRLQQPEIAFNPGQSKHPPIYSSGIATCYPHIKPKRKSRFDSSTPIVVGIKRKFTEMPEQPQNSLQDQRMMPPPPQMGRGFRPNFQPNIDRNLMPPPTLRNTSPNIVDKKWTIIGKGEL